MALGHLDLLFDQVEVIEQPFGGGGDTPALAHGQSCSVEFSEDVLVLAQPSQQTVGALPGNYLVTGSQCVGVARQLFDAEQLGSQRRLVRVVRQSRMSSSPVLKAQWQRRHVDSTSEVIQHLRDADLDRSIDDALGDSVA